VGLSKDVAQTPASLGTHKRQSAKDEGRENVYGRSFITNSMLAHIRVGIFLANFIIHALTVITCECVPRTGPRRLNIRHYHNRRRLDERHIDYKDASAHFAFSCHAGPGGYVAAIKAAQLGQKVVLNQHKNNTSHS